MSWTVTFSETVTGVDAADFALRHRPGVTGAVDHRRRPAAGRPDTVTVSTGTGDGTLGLNLVDDDTITDAAGNQLGGTGAGNGNFTGQVYTIDRTAPTVTNVTSSTANGSYTVGAVIPIQVTFSETVTVTGTPQLTLETGASDAVVNYTSGSGTNTLTFTYTVAAGHTSADLDYVSTTSLALNGGTIKDARRQQRQS